MPLPDHHHEKPTRQSVRPVRQEVLCREGPVVHSPLDDVHLRGLQIVTVDQLLDRFDLVVLSCKAQQLEAVIADLKAAGGLPRAILLPLLNGIKQYDRLDQAFGGSRVAGGLCRISR